MRRQPELFPFGTTPIGEIRRLEMGKDTNGPPILPSSISLQILSHVSL